MSNCTVFPIREARTGPQLFFFPDLGGGALYGKKVILQIESDIACYGIKFDPESFERVQTLQDLAQRIAVDLRASNISEPFHLIGHSFAGLLAYETACQLSKLGSRVGSLILLDTRVPRLLYSKRLYFRAVAVARALRNRQYKLAKKILLGASIRDPDSLYTWYTQFDLSKYPSSYLSIFKKMLKARANYVPESYAGDITLFKATDFRTSMLFPKYLGWEYFTKGKINVCRIRCNHHNMTTDDRATKEVAVHLLHLLKKLE